MFYLILRYIFYKMETFLEDLEEIENLEIITNPRFHYRPRIFRKRPNFFVKFDDIDFFKRYRLSKSSVIFILDKIEALLEYKDNR